MYRTIYTLVLVRSLLALVVFTNWLAGALALEPATDPNLAVVRIKSHGGSGTVIATTDGKSWILSCAHMFFDANDRVDPKLVNKKIVIDGPTQPYAKKGLFQVRVMGIDADQDLSLLELGNGPFNYVPVAKPGHQPGRNIYSCGYDEMKWPITSKPATILTISGDWLFTREKPWHGRSGGGLFDVDARVLIGVVNGYETKGQQRGVYASHSSVLRFISVYRGSISQVPARPPEPIPQNRYSERPRMQPWQAPMPLCPS